MKIYLSGPMTGYPENNRPVFHAMAARLRAVGYDVLNPAELDQPGEELTWDQYMRRDITVMMRECFAVATFGDWKKSRGATTEVAVARHLGWPVFDAEKAVQMTEALYKLCVLPSPEPEVSCA